MSKKIEWIKRGMTANNSLHMQEICDKIAEETSPENLTSVIKGSDTVVVDVAEDKQTVEVHLDAEVTQKIDNSLQTPTTSPSATQLVAVGTNKAQTMLNIGEGLSVENGSLKASGNSKLYYKIVKVTGVMLNYTFYYGYYSKNNVKPSSYQELKNDILGNNTGTIQLPLFVNCPQNDTKVVIATALKVSPSSYIQICFESSTVTDGVMNTQYAISNRNTFNPTDMEVFEI